MARIQSTLQGRAETQHRATRSPQTRRRQRPVNPPLRRKKYRAQRSRRPSGPAESLKTRLQVWVQEAGTTFSAATGSPARNLAIFSFKNFASAGSAAAPAGCPHSEGIGSNDTVCMNCASYRASPTGKYWSVIDGIYKNGTLIEPSAFFSSPPNPGVVPTSCFSQV